MKITLSLAIATELLLIGSTTNAATLAGNSSTPWNEQLPAPAQDLFEIPSDADKTYNDLSKNIDNLLNPGEKSDFLSTVGSAKKILSGASSLLNLPSRLEGDIQSLNISDLLNNVFANELAKILNQDLGDVPIITTRGVLGLPDPIEAGNDLEKNISNLPVRDFELNPALRASLDKKQFHRNYTYANIKAVVGSGGQQVTKQETQQALKSVLLINQAAQKAQKANVTQDILKLIAVQNTQQALIGRALLPETQMLNRQVATTNINLTNISDTLDSEQRAKASEANAQANAFLRQAVFQNQLWERGH